MAANISTNSSSRPETPLVTLTFPADNMTTQNMPSVAASTAHNEGSTSSGAAIAITVVLIVVAAVVIFTYLYKTKKGKLSKMLCWKRVRRSRISSTSSIRRALEEQDETDSTVRAKKRHENAEDMFTIDDFDKNAETQEGREEYFYDEVFGQSQFEDEATNNSMRRLYSDQNSQPDDLDLSDVDLESLGITGDSCTPDSVSKTVT